MNWLLNLFPQYRALVKAHALATESVSRLQEQNFALTEQSARLIEEAQESRRAQIEALQAIANIKIQLEFGGMPPYPGAYSLPKQVERETGPMPTNRVQGRDLVRAGMDEFQEQIRTANRRQ